MPRRPGLSAGLVWSVLQLLAAAAMSGRGFADERGPYALAPTELPQQLSGPEDDTGGHNAARAAYTSGLAEFQAGAYAQAAELFARADALSSSPNAKLMLARCLRQLERRVEAYRVLVECMRNAETTDPMRYAKTRIAASLELEVLRDQIGLLTVFVHAGRGQAYLHVAGQPVPREQWQTPLPVAPGLVRISLETLPGVIEHRDIDVLAGQTASVVIGPPPDLTIPIEIAAPQTMNAPSSLSRTDTTTASPLRLASYITGATGAASLIAFGILGGVSVAAFNHLEKACPNRVNCDDNLRSVAQRGETLQTGANIALVTGITLLATGVTLFVVSDDPEVGPGRAALVASPEKLNLRGDF